MSRPKIRVPDIGKQTPTEIAKAGPFSQPVTVPLPPPPATSLLASKLQAVQPLHANGQRPPHLIVMARAGTGKTTTLVEGLKVVMGLEPSLTPSPQQQAVWDEMARSRGARTVAFVAFNKALRNDQVVFTPNGWQPIGEVEVGQQVYGPDGKPHTVTKVHPVGLRPMMEVSFSDGTVVVADEEHLWVTETINYQKGDGQGWSSRDRWKVRTTDEIYRTVEALHRVPRTRPLELPNAVLPLDPYLLGALIGDGSFVYNAVTFCCVEQDGVNLVAAALPSGHELVSRSKDDWGVVSSSRLNGFSQKGSNSVMNELRRTGLQGCRSHEKFIPQEYLLGSISQRLSLLQGLMDTDGCSNGVISPFVTTSPRLALAVEFLCQSLGGVCSIRLVNGGDYKDSYWVNVRIDMEMCPFRLPRKVASFRTRKRDEQTPRKIVSVNVALPAEATCISIDSDDHLFLTAGLIPTHNSIATELQARVPEGVEAMTMHSMGYKAVQAAYGRAAPDDRNVEEIVADLMDVDLRELRREKPALLSGVREVVGHCKKSLIDPTEENMAALVAHHEIELDCHRGTVFFLVPEVLNRCRHPKGKIDFDDMIWLPVVNNLPIPKRDLLLVDEAQDLNRCQQELAMRVGRRLILCGDDKQCHPAGTLVTKTGGQVVPIETLRVGDQLTSFNPNQGRLVGVVSQGRRVEAVACREYSGPLYHVNGTPCTPNHKWPTKFDEAKRDWTAFYLMELEDGSFRIGLTQLMHKGANGFGPGLRARQEGAVKLWILDVLESRNEAREQEFKNSIRFQVPQRAQYEEGEDSWPKELIDEGCEPKVDDLLTSYGRLYEFPLWEKGNNQHIGTRRVSVTQTCNLIPTVNMVARRCSQGQEVLWELLDLDLTEDWHGNVWSLQVQPTEKDRRLYLANNLVTSNSIYGFAGADTTSMSRMEDRLKEEPGCTVLPLTVTRRCGHAIVEEARKIVPDFEAFPANGPGMVSEARYPIQGGKDKPRTVLPDAQTYVPLVQDGDMVICRVNAPLVSQCFRFLKSGKKANIQGRDIGQGLISTINKLSNKGSCTVTELVAKVSDWVHAEVAKEQAKRTPNENRIIGIEDRGDCIVCMTEGMESVAAVVRRIEAIFTDSKDKAGIRLSSIHRAKGLEAKRVFFLMPEGSGCPHPLSKGAWQRGQEINLLYVGITRAIEELWYVR